MARTDERKSVTLSYNTNYTLDITAKNCAGHSSQRAMVQDIFIGMLCIILLYTYMHAKPLLWTATIINTANCSTPVLTSGVTIEPYNSTIEGAIIYFSCKNGLFPNERRMAVCGDNGQWSTNLSSES